MVVSGSSPDKDGKKAVHVKVSYPLELQCYEKSLVENGWSLGCRPILKLAGSQHVQGSLRKDFRIVTAKPRGADEFQDTKQDKSCRHAL